MTKLNLTYKNSKARLTPILDEVERPDFVKIDPPADPQNQKPRAALLAHFVKTDPLADRQAAHNLIAQGKIQLEKVIHFFSVLVSTRSAAVVNYAYPKSAKRNI